MQQIFALFQLGTIYKEESCHDSADKETWRAVDKEKFKVQFPKVNVQTI